MELEPAMLERFAAAVAPVVGDLAVYDVQLTCAEGHVWWTRQFWWMVDRVMPQTCRVVESEAGLSVVCGAPVTPVARQVRDLRDPTVGWPAWERWWATVHPDITVLRTPDGVRVELDGAECEAVAVGATIWEALVAAWVQAVALMSSEGEVDG